MSKIVAHKAIKSNVPRITSFNFYRSVLKVFRPSESLVQTRCLILRSNAECVFDLSRSIIVAWGGIRTTNVATSRSDYCSLAGVLSQHAAPDYLAAPTVKVRPSNSSTTQVPAQPSVRISAFVSINLIFICHHCFLNVDSFLLSI